MLWITLEHVLESVCHQWECHLSTYLGEPVPSVGQERALWPSKKIESAMPEPEESKCDPEVDGKPVRLLWNFSLKIWHYLQATQSHVPVIDPVQRVKGLGRLKVVREDKVVNKGNEKPHLHINYHNLLYWNFAIHYFQIMGWRTRFGLKKRNFPVARGIHHPGGATAAS